MSRSVYPMTERFERSWHLLQRAPRAPGRHTDFQHRQPFVTLPLLCSVLWSRLQVEGFHQVDGGCTQGHLVQGRPQVDHVALLAALRVKTLEHVVFEVHAEGSAATVGAMNGTRAAAMRAGAAQARRQTQMIEHARDRQLPLEVREVNEDTLAPRWRLG